MTPRYLGVHLQVWVWDMDLAGKWGLRWRWAWSWTMGRWQYGMMYGVLHRQSVLGVGVWEYSGDGLRDGLWGHRQCGGAYGVSQWWNMFGVVIREYSGIGGQKLCPLTGSILAKFQCIGKSKVTYWHTQHMMTEARYIPVIQFTSLDFLTCFDLERRSSVGFLRANGPSR